MYKVTSNQIADQSEVIVELDLIRRGFVPLFPRSRDHIYDILVERSHERGQRPVFETIQVKTVRSGNKVTTSTRSSSASERVSIHGKLRNNTRYADFLIDWIAAVTYTGDIHYYPYEVYRHYEVLNIEEHHGYEFGSHHVPTSRAKTPQQTHMLFDETDLTGKVP
jgi:hypothetical protein